MEEEDKKVESKENKNIIIALCGNDELKLR